MTSPSGLLAALTGRGRGLVAGGTVTTVVGLLAGQRDLLRVGVLLLALPVVAYVVLARGRVRLTCTRSVSPASVPVGAPATVRLRVENASRLTTGVLLLEDRLSPALGSGPRFLLARVKPGRGREVDYVLTPGVRGRHEVGPLSVRLADPFGLCELVRVFPGALHLVVTPAVEPLPAVRLGGDRAGSGDGLLAVAAATGEQDATTREWRQGDDLRKVHWRSTARTGELMVRQEEQHSRARAVVLLDARAAAHTGTGRASTLEAAVRAAASVTVHLLRAGYGLRLLPLGAATPAETSLDTADGDAGVEVALERLAVLAAGRRGGPLAAALGDLPDGPAREPLLVAALGRVDAADADALARLRSGSRVGVALVAGPAVPGPDGADPLDLLRAAGWRVAAVPPGVPLAPAWTALGGRGAASPTLAEVRA